MIPLESDEIPNEVPAEVAVSICLITYNHAPYIRQAMESILMQATNFSFEICIGEDDSKDGTREICQEYARLHPQKIRLFLRHDKDKIYINGRKTGRSNSRRTRAACRGKYIALLEGDDFWMDASKLQKQYDFLEKNPQFPICATRCLFWDCQHANNTRIAPSLKYKNFVTYSQLVKLQVYAHTSTYFYKRKEMMELPNWIWEVIQGDNALIFTLAGPVGGLPILEQVTSVYRISGGGIWSGLVFSEWNDLYIAFWEKFLAHAMNNSDQIGIRNARKSLKYLEFNKKYVRNSKGIKKTMLRLMVAVRFPSIILPFLQYRWREKLSHLIWRP